MRRLPPLVAVLAALLALSAASAVAAEQPSRALRRLAAAADPSCPRAALYIIPALPNVKDAATFQLVRAAYIDTVKRLAPAGAISDVLPFSTEPNSIRGGILAHTIVLFSRSCEAGKAAARTLHVTLLGDVRPLFYVPAPRARSLFGNVYMVTVGFPYLADGYGRELAAPAAPAGTNLAAQFSITWWDIPPSKIGEQQAAAFKAAILKQLPAGAGVYFTTMITQGVSYRFGNHWRACAAPVSPTVAKTAGVSSQGGVVWPPGQPADVKSGRLVFNTNIHGTVFNTAAGRQTLSAFLDGLRRNPAAVFPRATFGTMVLSGGSGLRLVNDAAFPCSCATVPAPVLVSAQGFGPQSATAAAAGAANVTWAKWRFSATPAGGAAVIQEADAPLVWWYNLAADTTYTIRVTGVTSSGQEAAGSNSLVIRTGRLGAPTIAAASPTGLTTALVYISPPTTGSAVTRYMVSVCLKSAPSTCVAANGTSSQVAVSGLAAGASYSVIATAVVGSSLVPASNSLSLTMPPTGAPILLTATATSAVTGAATATAPTGVTFQQYTFTAKPRNGASATSTVANPLGGRFSGLRPATLYDVSVVGRSGATSPGSNTLSFVTPAANAPLSSATARSATVVAVSVSPPGVPPANGGTWAAYDVTLCPVSGPQVACVTQRIRGSGRRRLLAISTATFSGRTPNTIYNFACTAISSLNERSGLSLTGQVATPAEIPPPTVVVGSITPTSAVATVTPPAIGRPWTSYSLTLCVAGTLDCTTTTCAAVAAPNAATSCTLSSLSAGVAYTVTASARRLDGTQSPDSEPAQFTTLTYPPPTVAVNSVGATSAVVTVTPPALGWPWASYSLVVCVKGSQSCNTTTCRAAASPNASTDCPIGGLSVGATYTVTASARQSGGAQSPASAPVEFTTSVYPAPSVAVSTITSVTAVATVTPPASGRPWASYSLTLCVKGSQSCTTTTCAAATDPNSPTSCPLTKLSMGVTYTLTASARRSDGSLSQTSAAVQFTTVTYPAPSVAVSSITSVTAVATVTPPATGRPWVSYSLAVCVKGSQSCSTTTCAAAADPNLPTSCPLTKLSMGVTYTVTATARRSDGSLSQTSAAVQFTTVTYPAPSVAVSNITSVTAVATVTPPATGRPWASYSLAVCVKSTQTCSTTTCAAVAAPNSPTSCSLTKLSMGVTYTVTATARRSDGSLSQTSAAVQFTTVVYPPPTVAVSNITPTSALATVTPPATGRPWSSYSLSLCTKGTLNCTTLNCTAVSAPNSPTNCSLPNLDMGVTYTLTASAQRSSDGMISPASQPVQFTTPVYPAPSIIVVASSITTSSANVSVAPPATAPAGGWTKYVITLCRVGGSCTKQDCTPVSRATTRTTCPLTSLLKNTNYTVSAAAVNGAISSQQSADKSFKTSNQDAPTIVSVDASYYDAVGCVKSPLEGGPWASFNCKLCQGTKCTDMPACPIGARRRRLAADTTCTSECYLPSLEASTAYTYSCVAASANNQVVTPASNVLQFETGQASGPEVLLDVFNPVAAQCWAPSGGPWSVCNMQLCKPTGFVRRLLFGPCASPIRVSCPFPAPPAQVAECSLAGLVEQEVPYDVESQAVKADGTRASEIGSQTGLTVPLFPKPAIQDLAVSSFLSWNMTIYPENSTPLLSYPSGSWFYYRIKATFTSGWEETHTCTAQRAGQVPLPTACPLTLQRTGDITFTATAFQGNPASVKATDLRSEASDPVSGSNRRRRR